MLGVDSRSILCTCILKSEILTRKNHTFLLSFLARSPWCPPSRSPGRRGRAPEIRGTRCIRITTHYTPVSSPSLRSTALACGKMDGTRLTVLRCTCSSTGRICWRHNEDLEYIIINCNFVSTLLIEIRERWIEKFLFPRKRREV